MLDDKEPYFVFAYDQLLKEVEDIDQMLKQVGFSKGWSSLKEAILQMKDEMVMDGEMAE